MKLDPDIVTLGKIVGGGFPIGVICGKEEIMQNANTSIHSKLKRTLKQIALNSMIWVINIKMIVWLPAYYIGENSMRIAI